jgi:undecaprenyl-diphosphatase
MRNHLIVPVFFLSLATAAADEPEVDAPRAAPILEAEPIRDGAIISISLGFAGLLELINSTGEVHPQQISPTFSNDDLLPLDRFAVTQTLDPNASTYSNVGLYAMLAYALADPIATGFREGNPRAALVDGVIYAEALSITWGVTNLAKIAVRRPRPIEYMEARAHMGDPSFLVSATDSSQSFFSGHASLAAATTATATYLAFLRSPHTARPWITLVVGSALTAFVSYERVRAGAHFPTDVIAGALAGGGIGILTAHFHRVEDGRHQRVWLGYAPEAEGAGGVLSLGGRF